MACEKCCSSRSDLVDKILEQGQRLRNVMVQSILNNDPFNTDVVCGGREPVKLDSLPRETNEKITAFLQGDPMGRRDEIEALETLRSMSTGDLCRTTDRTYRSERSGKQSQTLSTRVNDNTFLKYVDSLKITIQSLSLIEAGRKKVVENDRNSVTQTYFLEYQIPDVLKIARSKSKVDTRLDSNGNVRMCARSSSFRQAPIQFKQVSVHDVSHLDDVNLDELELKFRVSFRGARQKRPNLLGHAGFRFACLETARNLSSSQELSVKLSETTPMVVGSLKMSLQLGCGRLYFGREFIEAMCNKRENSILESPGGDWIPQKLEREAVKPICSEVPRQVLFGFVYVSEAQFSRELQNSYLTCQSFGQDDRIYSKVVEFDANPLYNLCQQIPLVHEEELLTKLRDNFMVVEFYEKEDNKDFVVGLTKLPLHQFYLAYRNQVVVKYLAEKKYPIISCDGWEPIVSPFDGDVVGQVQTLLALGTKEQIEALELDRGFKNSIVRAKPNLPPTPLPPPPPTLPNKTVKSKEKLPSSITPRKETHGKKQEATSTAPVQKKKRLTTEIASHISITDNNNPVIVVPTTSSVDIATQAELNTPKTSPRKRSQQHFSSPKSVRFEEKIDVGIQCEKMEDNKNQKDESQQQQQQQQSNNSSIETLLNQLMAPIAPPPQHPSSSAKPALDLASLGFPDVSRDVSKYFEESVVTRNINRPKTTFRAHVFIEKAMHLPFRKKCRSRKNKGRKHIDDKLQQESMPCTYVTFEVNCDREVKATAVCDKPEWNYRCDVDLNLDLLRDKHMVFKVWRKPATSKLNNTNQQPNVQTDAVVGFASVDLSALASGLPSIQGWYNILEFSGKIQGQMNIHITPLENVVRHDLAPSRMRPLQIDTQVKSPESGPSASSSSDPVTPSDEPGELLGRTLKRKFTELDEITQRLRLRLSKVTNDESDASNDDVADEFERDINTLCVEDDYDTLSFDDDDASASKNGELSLLHCTNNDDTSTTLPDEKRCFLESKQKIDSLLEKLSLISGENSRYVSGCSGDAGNILEELDKHSRPSLYSVPAFDAAMRQKFGDAVVSDSYTDFSDDCRKAPEGEGNSSSDASKSTTTE